MASANETTPVSSRRWVSLGATCTAAGLVWLAFADLGVAIPTIADDLQADMATLQWANNAFSLVTGALVIAAGRFGDVYGRRRMLQIGVALFGVFSVVAALAPGVGVLILGRGLMGIGAALILPATLALIPPQFSGREQLTAFGIWQAVAWGGQAVGPAIGGVITQTVGWQGLFWLNVPLAALTYLTVRAVTPESSDADASHRVDWTGLVTIGLAVFALLYALTDGPSAGWGSPLVIGLLVVSVLLAVAWYVFERRASEPLVDLALFKLRDYDGALTANLVMNLTFAGASYLLVLWLQNIRGYGAVEAGLLMLPATVGIFAFIPLGGRLDASVGSRRPVLVGLVVLGLGLLTLGLLSEHSSIWLLAVGLLVMGVGLGLLSTPISNTAVGNVPVRLAGTAAGVFKMSSMVGGALGVAALTAFARGFTSRDVGPALQDSGLLQPDIDQAHQALVNSASFADALATLPPDLASAITKVATAAFSAAVGDTMVATAVVTLLSVLVVALLWPRRTAAER
jgi:EmrB/QacA subfamily drug resistance transporter